MTFKHSRFASSAALAAALSLAATPAAAVELPVFSAAPTGVETGAAAEQNHHRWRRHRHRNRVDAGDVITGVLVLGTIAAVAGVFDGDRNRRDRDYRDRDYRDRDYRDRDNDNRRDRYESNGIERAAEMCVDQVERGDDRVSDVREASRRSDGWHVSGTLEAGGMWSCWIDNDGRVRNIDFGAATSRGGYDNAGPAGGTQWDDDAYARARETTRTPGEGEYTYRSADASTVQAETPQPDYPGGPLPDEEGYAAPEGNSEIDADLD